MFGLAVTLWDEFVTNEIPQCKKISLSSALVLSY